MFSKNTKGKLSDTETKDKRPSLILETKYYSRGKEIPVDEIRQRAKEAEEEIRKADLKDKAIKENLRIKYCRCLDEAVITYPSSITYNEAQSLTEACSYVELVWEDIHGKDLKIPANVKDYITHTIAEDKEIMRRIFSYGGLRKGTTAYKLVSCLIKERYKPT